MTRITLIFADKASACGGDESLGSGSYFHCPFRGVQGSRSELPQADLAAV